MHRYIAHVTPRDGIVRGHPIRAEDVHAARAAAQALAAGLYGSGFTYSVCAGPYYDPIACRTGALHQQPSLGSDDYARFGGSYLAPLTGGAFTPDYSTFVDLRGALDAPDSLPSGGQAAADLSGITLGIAHVRREPRGAA